MDTSSPLGHPRHARPDRASLEPHGTVRRREVEYIIPG
jgi:hypothetical protein